MADRAEVVVVGGGVMGCAMALHLLKAGVRDVRLIERDEVGQGTTAAGGGFLADWAPQEPEIQASRYGREFYSALHDNGHDISYRANSTLYIAAGEAAWRALSDGGNAADESVLSPAEVEARTGGAVPASGVHAGLLDEDGAQVHAPKVVSVLADRVRAAGGVIDSRRPVTGITVQGGRVREVQTVRGSVGCEAVVLAAGAWNNTMANWLGFLLPQVPQVTSRVHTGPLGIPDTMPALFLTGLAPEEPAGGTMLWVRGQDGGLLWGGTYEVWPRDVLVGEPVPDRLDQLPIDGVLEILRIAERGRATLPALASREHLRISHGAPCYTPDMRALVGAVPGVTGAYILAGDNESGITYGPGYARALTRQITEGTGGSAGPDEWRPDRFADRFTDPQQIREALREHSWT
ncbi:NAD(P)/FAD-dependent oxidoreductase [Actinoalloteichus hymeniacidonis]|nr:FAD-binding oxidoreductase [Actinoalloteichus hymeniacidonis]MBB5910095.1 glycine/D-amino acid oxidase-like deaminating enzyme [Actinoalloteichus hymeniacidonis]